MSNHNPTSPALAVTHGSAFRWAYAAVCALAVKILEEDNRTCGDNWPGGQSWDDLAGSSRSIYLHRARELAGIPHADFLAVVRGDVDEIADIYERGSLPPNAGGVPRPESAPTPKHLTPEKL